MKEAFFDTPCTASLPAILTSVPSYGFAIV